MGEVVNLRQARKARDKRQRGEKAQENRVAFGRTKAERELTSSQKRLDAARLDAHRRETPEDPA